MMNLEEINKAIQELENSDLTYDTCQKLAMLYTVRDHNIDHTNTIYNPVLPSYNTYCEDKRRCKLGQLSKESIIEDLRFVCSEILTLVRSLYSSTECDAERDQLKVTIEQLKNIYL